MLSFYIGYGNQYKSHDIIVFPLGGSFDEYKIVIDLYVTTIHQAYGTLDNQYINVISGYFLDICYPRNDMGQWTNYKEAYLDAN